MISMLELSLEQMGGSSDWRGKLYDSITLEHHLCEDHVTDNVKSAVDGGGVVMRHADGGWNEFLLLGDEVPEEHCYTPRRKYCLVEWTNGSMIMFDNWSELDQLLGEYND